MTISNSNNRNTGVGDGSTTEFFFTFKVFSDAELAVYINDALASESSYTVSGVGSDSGGAIELSTPPIPGASVVILRDMNLTQEADYVDGDAFSAETHERQLDRQVMMIQQVAEQSMRSIKVPPSSESADPIIELEDLQEIATITDSIKTVADLDTQISAVVTNETNINDVAENLPAIQAVAPTLTMTNSELDLVVDGNSEVAGVSYPNVTEAIEYAKSVLQVGGLLKVSIPQGSTIIEPSPPSTFHEIGSDYDRLKLDISSSSGAAATTTWDLNESSIQINNGGFLQISNLTVDYNATSGVNSNMISISRGATLILQNAMLNTAQRGLSIGANSTLRIAGLVTINAAMNGVTLQFGAHGILYNLTINSTSATFTQTMLSVLGATAEGTITINGNNNPNLTGVRATNGAVVALLSSNLSNIAGTSYDPPADTYGNYHSRIITAP